MAPTFLSSMSEGFDLFINYLQELDGGEGGEVSKLHCAFGCRLVAVASPSPCDNSMSAVLQLVSLALSSLNGQKSGNKISKVCVCVRVCVGCKWDIYGFMGGPLQKLTNSLFSVMNNEWWSGGVKSDSDRDRMTHDT